MQPRRKGVGGLAEAVIFSEWWNITLVECQKYTFIRNVEGRASVVLFECCPCHVTSHNVWKLSGLWRQINTWHHCSGYGTYYVWGCQSRVGKARVKCLWGGPKYAVLWIMYMKVIRFRMWPWIYTTGYASKHLCIMQKCEFCKFRWTIQVLGILKKYNNRDLLPLSWNVQVPSERMSCL